MEKRAASHTEEEELNQRRRLLNLARRGDPKAINKLFELYQVRVYSGDSFRKKNGRLPPWPTVHNKPARVSGRKRPRQARRSARPTRRRVPTRRVASRRRTTRVIRRSSRRGAHR